MKIIKTKFKDLLIIKQKNNSDKRGSLRETFNKRILKSNFVFEYCTTSQKKCSKRFSFSIQIQTSEIRECIKGKNIRLRYRS